MNIFLFLAVLGLFVGSLTAVAQFLITHEKYSSHFIDKRQPLKIAIETALYTLVFFVILTLVIGFVLSKLMGR